MVGAWLCAVMGQALRSNLVRVQGSGPESELGPTCVGEGLCWEQDQPQGENASSILQATSVVDTVPGTDFLRVCIEKKKKRKERKEKVTACQQNMVRHGVCYEPYPGRFTGILIIT